MRRGDVGATGDNVVRRPIARKTFATCVFALEAEHSQRRSVPATV
jgi:hypothetical protein